MNIFKITLLLAQGDKDEYSVTKQEQQNFLYSLKEPKDFEERSYNQYLSQSFFRPKWKVLLLNLFSVLFIIPVWVYLIIKKYSVKESSTIESIGSFKGIEEVIPKEISIRYDINNDVFNAGYSLSLSDIIFIIKYYYKYLLSPFFVLKCSLLIGSYSTLIRKYHPANIFVHSEYSFTSSALTHYCKYKGVKHINVMHGEKCYLIRDSFFQYDACYVWNEYYKDLLIRLRAEKNQFIIAIPPSLVINVKDNIRPDYYSDYKYYLAEYNDKEIRSIVKSMEFAIKKGYSVKYRPHPRYSDVDLLKQYVDESFIENPREVSIILSISNLGTAVGSTTTVLTQAYFSGKNVALDDMTFRDRYEKAKDLEFFLVNKGLPTLSSLQ